MIHYVQFVNMARKIAAQSNPHSFQDATQGGDLMWTGYHRSKTQRLKSKWLNQS